MKADDEKHMQTALDLARKGYGRTSPNPLVGALLVKGRAVIGKGWHRAPVDRTPRWRRFVTRNGMITMSKAPHFM